MNREQLFEILKYNLRQMSLQEFAGIFINKPKAIEEFYKLCHDIKGGNTISLLFNPHRLSTSTCVNHESVYSSLQSDRLLSGLARLYLYNLEHGITNPLYSSIQRGFQNVQYVNEFPPIVARTIYKRFLNLDEPVEVLDPCAGWGGRMIGAASLGISYTACEPCTETYSGLIELGNWLKVFAPKFNFDLFKVPYEDFKSDKLFDFALTSPPYYDTEHYSDEETNSFNRYKTLDDWVNGFFEPLIVNTVNRLKDDGKFVLNIGDRKYNLSSYAESICAKNGFYIERIDDYLAGNGENREKFYCISKQPCSFKTINLF